VANTLAYLGPIISCEENLALIIQFLGAYSQHFIFFATYEWAQLARLLPNTRLERLARTKTLELIWTHSKAEKN
jgi:hypothetical protein